MQKITIKGNEVEVKWGMWANREFAARKGLNGTMEYLEFLQVPGMIMDCFAEMVLLGIEYAAMKSGNKPEVTEGDVLVWVDENGMFEDGSRSKELLNYILSGGKELNLTDNPITDGEKKTTD